MATTTTPTMITRTGAEALIPTQTTNEIIQNLATRSTFLSLARRLPNMTSKQMKIPVLTGLATAKFVSGDTGKKPLSNLTWDKVYITAEEIAVIIPIPEAVLDDATYDIWGEVRPRIEEAFGKAIDAAAFFGTNKPDSFPAGLVPGAVTAGNVVTISGNTKNLYEYIMGEDGVIAKVEDQGQAANGFVGALKLKAKIRNTLDSNKQPIFRTAYSNGATSATPYELEGHPVIFPQNGSWDADAALLLAGNFQNAVYSIRQDITYKIFDQGTATTDSGAVTLSAMENDCVFLRAVMRMGWALPKPVNPVSGTNYYPFSILKQGTATPPSGT